MAIDLGIILVNIYVTFFTGIFWQWYVVIGFFVSFGVAFIMNRIIVQNHLKFNV